MKHIWKMTAAALTLGICIVGTAVPVSAQTEDQTDTVYLCDEGDKLTGTAFQDVFSMLEDTAEETGMNLGVWVGSEPMGESATIAFCDDTYDQLFGINTDGVFLYLDLSGESDLFDYISTSGKGQFYYTNSNEYDRIDDIFSDMNPYLPRGEEDVPSAISEFCFNLKYYAEKGAPSDTYYTYNADNNMYLIMENGVVKEVAELPEEYTAVMSWGMIALIAVVIGFVSGGVSLIVIRMRYRFKTAGSMQHYLEQGNIRYSNRTDRFLRQYRTRTRISSDSSSGGGGGGGGGSSHSSSGGGSHGGGGNHR